MPKQKMTAESLVSFMAAAGVTKARLAHHLGFSPSWVDAILLGVHRPGYGKLWVFSEERRAYHVARLESAVRELVALDTKQGGPPIRHGPRPQPYAERLKRVNAAAKKVAKRGKAEAAARAAKKAARQASK